MFEHVPRVLHKPLRVDSAKHGASIAELQQAKCWKDPSVHALPSPVPPGPGLGSRPTFWRTNAGLSVTQPCSTADYNHVERTKELAGSMTSIVVLPTKSFGRECILSRRMDYTDCVFRGGSYGQMPKGAVRLLHQLSNLRECFAKHPGAKSRTAPLHIGILERVPRTVGRLLQHVYGLALPAHLLADEQVYGVLPPTAAGVFLRVTSDEAKQLRQRTTVAVI